MFRLKGWSSIERTNEAKKSPKIETGRGGQEAIMLARQRDDGFIRKRIQLITSEIGYKKRVSEYY